MPFSPELDDVYYLGIYETAKALRYSCKRLDEAQFVGNILDKICEFIKNSKFVLAEISYPNENVYFELGYAYALGKPTILITKNISSTPFDVRGLNHIIYTNIRDLRNKLKNSLLALQQN